MAVITPQQVSAYAYQIGCTLTPVSDLDAAVLRGLDKMWAKIQEQNSRIPPAIFSLTSGRSSSCISARWDQPSPVIEVNLQPEGQKLTPADLLEFLLHQAAHSIAGPVRASEGRWHNRPYKEAAEAIGLDTAVDSTGYGATSLASGTRTRYRNEVAALDRALTKWEPAEQAPATHSPRNGVALVCSCVPPRKIRLRGDPEKINITGIRCEICGQPFAVASSSASP
jgi:hypothetical protein